MSYILITDFRQGGVGGYQIKIEETGIEIGFSTLKSNCSCTKICPKVLKSHSIDDILQNDFCKFTYKINSKVKWSYK